MIYPALEEVKVLSGDFNLVPVVMEVHADMETPIRLFRRFASPSGCFLLESVEGGEKWARYSIMGRNPLLTVKSSGMECILQWRHGAVEQRKGNPVETLQDILKSYRTAKLPGLPQFSGGFVGYFGYDVVRYFEQLPPAPADDLQLPDAHLMLADELLVFDHLKQKIFMITHCNITSKIEACYAFAVDRLQKMYHDLYSTDRQDGGELVPIISGYDDGGQYAYTSNVTKTEFCQNVSRAKEYIRDGDIFQVVLSQRFCIPTTQNPLNVYRALRILNPSPYMYYLKFNDYTIVGASPEMLVRVEDGKVETCPIAGTRKRGATPAEDEQLARDLLADAKELAEHTMLVDLGRNDVGKVAQFGTVEVKDPMHIEKYSHVMHLVSNVQGKLREDKTAFDALQAVLPAGTLSGAPKVRAMEIINELENVKRGPYGGAIGYIGFHGNLDSCITIRTLVFAGDKAYLQAGAGIVADSVPEAEYDETMNKAKALLRALKEAEKTYGSYSRQL